MASLALSSVMLIFLIGMVQGRMIRLNTSNQLGSDGLNVNPPSPYLLLNGLSSSPGVCMHDYGFFPCADNIGGYLFQIIFYQYLLFVGGHFITNGSKKLFTMLGTGIFGASVFRVLLALPRIMFVIISGVFSSKEQAQQQVSLGVAAYAGSTVLSLTLLWGTCVIVGRTDIPKRSRTESSSSDCLLLKEKCSGLKGTGVTTDKETSHTAGIMLLSLVPYAILQLMNIFNTSLGSRMVMLIALTVSIILLLAYFVYQVFDPWIQVRSLEYSKYEKLVAEFLQYALKHAKGKLVDENGQPNIPTIERLFTEADIDNDKRLTVQELENVILEMESGNVQVDENYALSQILKTFDLNNDGEINEEEFIAGSMKWINEAKKLVENGDSTTRKFLSEIVEPFTQRKKDEINDIEELTGKILKRVQSQTLRGLLDDDGNPNIEHIKTLFRQFDSDNNNSISRDELRQLIGSDKFEGVQPDDETVDEWMKEFDEDGNNVISEQEFVSAVKRWLKEATKGANSTKETKKTTNEFDDKINWEEVDNKLFYKITHNGSIKEKLLVAWALSNPILQIILGVAMLTFLAKPFMESILQLSDAMGLSTFFISFVIVPLISNAKTAISAIFQVSQKSRKTASLTFSEIYGEVIMNNIMGLATLLAIVYAKELTWDYSVEVLIIFVICAVVGVLAFLCTTYPLWTCFLAFFMYLFSLALFYVLKYFWTWN